MRSFLTLIRPQQWVKNAFVLLPLFFGGALFHSQALISGLITLLAFCFTASSIYCFNDIYDVEDDRQHPIKQARPIASGRVSVAQAYLLMLSMLALAIITLCFLPQNSMETACILLAYYVLNLCYCIRLKHYAIIDVCVVAFGFVLRVLAGGLSTGVILSRWIVLMTFLLTLFLSLAKRNDDVQRMNETGKAPRKNTVRYNTTFIQQAITITATVTLVCYIMYTVSPEVTERFHTDELYLTSFFVLIGLLRYIQLAFVDKKSGDPTQILLHDRFIQLILAAWLLSFGLIIYYL